MLYYSSEYQHSTSLLTDIVKCHVENVFYYFTESKRQKVSHQEENITPEAASTRTNIEDKHNDALPPVLNHAKSPELETRKQSEPPNLERAEEIRESELNRSMDRDSLSESTDSNGLKESLQSQSPNGKKPPIELLCRVFPHMKRSVLQLILQGCNNDVVLTIEQVLNNHSSNAAAATSSTSQNNAVNPAASMLSFRPYLPATAGGPGANGMKSAFSPFTTFPSPHPAQMRYAYAAGAGRNMAQIAAAMPYPPGFMPNFASMTAAANMGYSMMGLGPANIPKSNVQCGVCPYTPYGPNNEKS